MIIGPHTKPAIPAHRRNQLIIKQRKIQTHRKLSMLIMYNRFCLHSIPNPNSHIIRSTSNNITSKRRILHLPNSQSMSSKKAHRTFQIPRILNNHYPSTNRLISTSSNKPILILISITRQNTTRMSNNRLS